MKGRILLGLFALPFAGVGAWMLVSVAMTLVAAHEMRGWAPVPATVLAGGYESNHDDDSTTYRAYATYAYDFDGRRYEGHRVQISDWSDNIGDFQQVLGRRMASAEANQQSIVVFVNPAMPTESIVDKRIRWGLIGFKMIFVLVFGGVGFGLLYAVVRAPAEKDAATPEYRESPWLVRDEWQSATISSNAKFGMWGIWIFAAFWNLVSAPVPFMIMRELKSGNTLALIALLFPIVGAGLLAWAIRLTFNWHKFGPTPVTLDPFPGSIGGNVGGSIETNIPFSQRNRFRISLINAYSYLSGSGDDRERRENLLWDDELVAHTESTPGGTRIVFRFDVPEGLTPADADRGSDSYHLWRISIRGELQGADFEREFDIPVYATAETSARISARSASAAIDVSSATYDEAIRDLVRVSTDGMRKRLVFPMGRHIVSNGAAILVGGSFAAAGWYLAVNEGERVFGGVFGGVGALVGLAALYMLFKSLHVTLDGDRITSVRRWFGIPVSRKSLLRGQFSQFQRGSEMQSQTGSQMNRYYNITGIDRSGRKALLGEGFKGEAEAESGMRFLERELGIREQAADSPFALNERMFVPTGTNPISG